jgi:hypothetical protein
MTPQDNLNNNLIQAVKECNLIKVKHLIEQGSDIHAANDCALKWSAYNGHVEVFKYLVIHCNMVINKKTVDYLIENNLSEIINIVKSKPL